MNTAIWIAIAVPIVLGASRIFGSRGRVDERQLARYAGRVGLPLPDALRAPVLARIRQRERTSVAFGLGGLVIGAVVGFVLEATLGDEGLGAPFLFLGAAFGMSLGSFVALRRMRASLVEGAPRVARSFASEADHYSTSAERFASRVSALTLIVAAAAGVGLLVLLPGAFTTTTMPIVFGVAVALAAASWLLLWWAERAAAATPQFANSDLELAWDDAERVSAVRELRRLMVAVGILPAVAFGVLTLTATDELRTVVDASWGWLVGLLAVGLVVLALVIVPLIASIVGGQEHNPSRRLWQGVVFGPAVA